MKRLLFTLLFVPLLASAEFCADLTAKYGTGIMRCVDFAQPIDAAMNGVTPSGNPTISTALFNGSVTATPGTTGTLHWKMRSYNQVRAEEPSLTPGQAWIKAISTNNYKFQRWIGVDKLTPGQTYYYQFKLRFNAAFKKQWGGGGAKIFGMDAGCRTINGVKKPKICENFTDFTKGFTTMGTASSVEFATMTSMNWRGDDPTGDWAYPVMYQGSANWAGTQGWTPVAFVTDINGNPQGDQQLEQVGPDVGLVWDDTLKRFKNGTTCDNWTRATGTGYGNRPSHVLGNGPCVTYGAPDVWHEITMALRPSGNFHDTNPGATTNREYRHDTMVKVWYDGQLLYNFDPDEPPFRSDQISKAQCQAEAVNSTYPKYDRCRLGIDITKDSRDVNPDPDSESFDGDVTQFILWTFNYRRGYAYPGWCAANIPTTDQYYGTCVATEGSGESATNHPTFDAFLSHQEVNVYMDDWVVSTVPLPMKRRVAGGKVGAGSFGLDARDIGTMLPPNTWTRLFPGPDKTMWNTTYGVIPPTDPNNPNPGSSGPAVPTFGVNNLTATNNAIEVPVNIGVPLGGGFVGVPCDALGNCLYFGGGHSGYMSNRVFYFDSSTGRWQQSQYTPDMGTQVVGATGFLAPTPPGTGCKTSPYQQVGGGTFATTGDTVAGSKVVTVANINNMCSIVGLCPGQEAQVGGYGIFGPGIPAGAAIYSVNRTTNQITMTLPATASGTGVAIAGGKALCTEGGTPNGSPGGRGWWEHMDTRYHWDPRANAWLMVQASGTWFYNPKTETWKLASGPVPPSQAEVFICGIGDYTALSTSFSPELNRMLAWCDTGGVWGYDYGSGAPNYTGAKWVKLNQVPQAIQNIYGDVLGQGVWDSVSKKFYYLTTRTAAFSSDKADPIVYWFDPYAAPSCATNAPPCGAVGRLDPTKPNYPQTEHPPFDALTQKYDPNHICSTSLCKQVTASITVDNSGALYIVGRRAGDGQIALWKATNPTGPNEAWTVVDTFYFNTYDNKGLRLLADKPPQETSYEFSINSSGMGMMSYSPAKNAFLLFTRSGSGNGGGSTRGTGDPQMGGCYLNGQPDDCFRMYAIRLDSTPVKPPPTGGTPVDCVMSEWSAWTPVGACTNGQQTEQRTRSIITPPQNGGAACGATQETRTVTCTTTPPPDKIPTVTTVLAVAQSDPIYNSALYAKINGAGATGSVYFTDNGAGVHCNPAAVGGEQNDRYAACGLSLPNGTHTIVATYSGDAKYAGSTSAPVQFTVGTTTPPPPVNCVTSEWSAWVPTSEWQPAVCTTGTQSRTEKRTRTVITPPANGGTACGALEETRTVTQTCVVPCVPKQVGSITFTRRSTSKIIDWKYTPNTGATQQGAFTLNLGTGTYTISPSVVMTTCP